MVEYIVQHGTTKEISIPTGGLRFVMRKGSRVLQQEFSVIIEYDPVNPDGKMARTQAQTKWEDVPLVGCELA